MTRTQMAEAFMAHAQANYFNGWDSVVECMTIAEIEDEFFTDGPDRFGFFADRKARTLAEAIEVVMECIDVREDRPKLLIRSRSIGS